MLRASPEVLESESRLRRLADTLPVYIAYVDRELRYQMVNRTYELWFRRPATEIVGQRVEAVLGGSFAAVEAHLRAALAGETERFETPMRTAEGERVLLVTHVPDRDADGTVQGVIIHGHDVTDQHRAERELRRSEETLRLALTAANGVGTWDWDLTTDQLRADATFAGLYGVDPDRASAGAPAREFTQKIHPEDLPRVAASVSEAIESCGEYALEYRLVTADAVRWVSARGRCTRGPDGAPLRFPGVVIDITERKRQETALVETEKLAAVGRLASSIAHEINNPLESVVNLLYLIEHDASENPKTTAFARLAQEELARVSQITTQTLRFFRQSTAPIPVAPEDLVNSVLDLYRGRLGNSRVQVSRRLRGDDAGRIFEGEIRQVLNNLVGNAIDAMRDGGCLTVRARPAVNEVSGRRGVRFTVSDTGPGMNRATLAKIFEPFFTTKGATGTGLGLWVSKQLAEKNEGRLRVRTSQHPAHRGTVFTLFVPYVTEQDEHRG